MIELGAGCGLPGITAAIACKPANVYITDINHHAIRNSIYNVGLNASTPSSLSSNNESIDELFSQSTYQHIDKDVSSDGTDDNSMILTKICSMSLNWKDPSTFPPNKADILIGSDL